MPLGLFFVAGSKKPMVLPSCLPVHPVTVLHPRVVDLLHVRLAEDVVGGDLWVAFKVLIFHFAPCGPLRAPWATSRHEPDPYKSISALECFRRVCFRNRPAFRAQKTKT